MIGLLPDISRKVFQTQIRQFGCSDNSMKIPAKRNVRTAMVGSGQVLLDSDKTVELLKSEKGKNSRWNALERGVAVTDLRAASKMSGDKREFLIFGWIDQVRVKNDRLWGESDCLNVRRSDGNRSSGVRRDRIK
ncbi:hypothetical protein YC2023_009936 [Brassica napus]